MPVDFKVIAPSVAATMNTQLIHEREKFCQEAQFASNLIQAWGMTGADNGETSGGHQRGKPIEPEDLVERAVLTTQLAFAAFRQQGWLIDMPPIEDLLPEAESKTGFYHAPMHPDDDIPF